MKNKVSIIELIRCERCSIKSACLHQGNMTAKCFVPDMETKKQINEIRRNMHFLMFTTRIKAIGTAMFYPLLKKRYKRLEEEEKGWEKAYGHVECGLNISNGMKNTKKRE